MKNLVLRKPKPPPYPHIQAHGFKVRASQVLCHSAERYGVCACVWTSEVVQCTLTPSPCLQGIMLLFMGAMASHDLGCVPLLPLKWWEWLL